MSVEVDTVRSVEVPTRMVHGPGALARLGGRDAATRASEIWRKTLEEYEQPPLDDGIRTSLGEYVVRRRAELGD